MIPSKKFTDDLHDAMALLHQVNKRTKRMLKNMQNYDWPQNRPDADEVQLRAKLNLKKAVDHSDKAADAVLQTIMLAAGFFGILFHKSEPKDKK